MYPLQPGMFAPKNQWYVAAWSSEVTRKPMQRWLLNEPVALYRKEDGAPAAIAGRCPHRHFPLSEGKLVGDNLQCGYHGLTFAPDGTCVSIPSQKVVPSACNIIAYPVAERWEWIWIWMGDPSLCDEALIPDHEAMDLGNPDFDTFPKAYFEIDGRYMLLHDNLLDLTHLAYLHESTIGSPEAAEVKETRSSTGQTLSSHRSIYGVRPLPYYSTLLNYNGLVDRCYGGVFHAPGLHALYEDYYESTGKDGENGALLMRGRVYHAVTPGKLHTSHYFFASGRDKPSGQDRESVIAAVMPVLEEDVFATVEIEKMIQSLGESPHDILLRADATCVTGRRLIETLIRKEQDPAPEGHIRHTEHA